MRWSAWRLLSRPARPVVAAASFQGLGDAGGASSVAVHGVDLVLRGDDGAALWRGDDGTIEITDEVQGHRRGSRRRSGSAGSRRGGRRRRCDGAGRGSVRAYFAASCGSVRREDSAARNAPRHSRLSPALVTLPAAFMVPEAVTVGTRPANLRTTARVVNRYGSAMSPAMIPATTGPTPGAEDQDASRMTFGHERRDACIDLPDLPIKEQVLVRLGADIDRPAPQSSHPAVPRA